MWRLGFIASVCIVSGVNAQSGPDPTLSLGDRPESLVASQRPGRLATRLNRCLDRTPTASLFSIGHRGAPMGYPEHSRESYTAAVRQGAGIVECDVTFTRDGTLVCRHSECDLHTPTNIIVTPLNAACSVPFNHEVPNPDSVRCCASDRTEQEFLSL